MPISWEIDEPLDSAREMAEKAAKSGFEGVLFLGQHLLGRVSVRTSDGTIVFEGPVGDILFRLALIGHDALQHGSGTFSRGIDWTGEQIRLRVEADGHAWLDATHRSSEMITCPPDQMVVDVDESARQLVKLAEAEAPWLLGVPFLREVKRLGRVPTRL